MADDDSGDKTEKPTAKRLKDAREKGDVPKSRDVTSTVGLVLWLALGSAVVTFAVARLGSLWEALFATVNQGWGVTGFAGAARALGAQAAELGLLVTAMLLVPVAAVNMLTDFLQIGPVLTFEKIKPSFEKLNPVEGIKRMFTMDNLIELIKGILKATALFLIGWVIVKNALPDIIAVARSPDLSPRAIGDLYWALTMKLLAWPLGVFVVIAMLDAGWQRYSFTKKMRMSIRDIKQEAKESEGDPFVKGQRRQLQQEWANRNSTNAARTANVLVVNPTHFAVAIDYDKQTCPVPTISAKGEDDVARAMRDAAEEAGVPIVRNVPLARDLIARAEVGEIVPGDLFDIIAEVILWAAEVRREVEALRNNDLSNLRKRKTKVPGEDLTHYPESPWSPSP